MGIDAVFMEFIHELCVQAGTILTPLFKLISFLGEKAWFFLLISFLLLLSKKTRWVGATAILAIFLGFIVSDICVKPLLARVRPYMDNMAYQDYWKLAGSVPDTGYCMPSGHTIGCVAFFVSLYIAAKKSWKSRISMIGTIATILMILSRTYFMHHYLTDCIAGVIIAIFTSYISRFIIKMIYKFCKSYEDIGLFNFIINFDLYEKLKK